MKTNVTPLALVGRDCLNLFWTWRNFLESIYVPTHPLTVIARWDFYEEAENIYIYTFKTYIRWILHEILSKKLLEYKMTEMHVK